MALFIQRFDVFDHETVAVHVGKEQLVFTRAGNAFECILKSKGDLSGFRFNVPVGEAEAIFNGKNLFDALSKVSASRATGEYYITDVPHIMKKMGLKVDAFSYGDIDEFVGVNTEEDLKHVEELLQK